MMSGKPKISMKKIVYLFFIISLFATVTNFVPLSVSFSALCFLFPFVFGRIFNRPVPKFYFFLLLIYVYFLISTLQYSPKVLLQPEFYRRDGNFFPVYLPIIILWLIPLQINIERITKHFVIWASLFSLIAYLILPAEAPHIHHLFFITHNAAGGFISILLALCIGQYLEKRDKIFFMLGILDFFLLWETGSRGSLLAIIIAIIQILILKGHFTKLLLLGATIIMVIILFYAYPIWVESGKHYGIPSIGTIDEIREDNINNRIFYLWPRALDNFWKSPIVGQGFGSYNDTPYHFEDFGIAVLNTSKIYINSDAHAHNSYLNILSETGLVGISLVIMFLVSLYRFIKRSGLSKGIDLGLRIAFWVVIWSSFTEHRLTAPAQMLPFTILVGFILSNFHSYQTRTSIAYESQRNTRYYR